jgi:hypothetical protein
VCVKGCRLGFLHPDAMGTKSASADVEILREYKRCKEQQEDVFSNWKNFWKKQQQVEADKRRKKVQRVTKVSRFSVGDCCGGTDVLSQRSVVQIPGYREKSDIHEKHNAKCAKCEKILSSVISK